VVTCRCSRARFAGADCHRTVAPGRGASLLVYRPLSSVLGIGAVAALVVGWARPAPWLLAMLLV